MRSTTRMARGVSVESLKPEKLILRSLPENLLPGDGELFQHELLRKSPETLMTTIQGAFSLSRVVLHRPTKNLVALTHPWDRKITAVLQDFIWSLKAIGRPLRKHQEGLWITDQWSRNYFHWITDCLPRLWMAREARVKSPIVIPEVVFRERHVRETLDAMEEDYLVLDAKSFHSFGTLTLLSPTAETGNPDPDLISQVGSDLRVSVAGFITSAPSNNPVRKIWVSRAQSRRRHLSNEPAVRELVTSLGFEIVCPEALSITEQFRTFASARVIAGQHGAGLTNILLAPVGGALIELRDPRDSHNNCYFALANAIGLDYYYLETEWRRGFSRNQSRYVDLDKLAELLGGLSR